MSSPHAKSVNLEGTANEKVNSMDIGKFLGSVGSAVLKNVPMGSMVLDIADAVLDDVLPDNATGDDIKARLEKLPPEQYERIMSKQIDADVVKYQTWVDLRKNMDVSSPASKARSTIALVFGVGIMLVTLMFTYLYIQHFLTQGTYPPLESVAIIYGIPMVILMAAFGIRSEKVLDFILTAVLKKIK